MTITRDMIQGFIDGYKAGNGNMKSVKDAVQTWLTSNSTYPQDAQSVQTILSDLASYR